VADLTVAVSVLVTLACVITAAAARDPWWLAGMATGFIALPACRNHITRGP